MLQTSNEGMWWTVHEGCGGQYLDNEGLWWTVRGQVKWQAVSIEGLCVWSGGRGVGGTRLKFEY